MDPTVTMDLEMHDKMRERVRTLEQENAKLQVQLAAQQMVTGGGELAYQLAEGLRSSLKIVQFAQGNLDPETIRGWPYQELVKLAKAMKELPTSTPVEKEWATDAMHYANVAEVLENARRRGVQSELKNIPRSALAVPGDYERQAQEIISKADKQPEAGNGTANQQEQPQQA